MPLQIQAFKSFHLSIFFYFQHYSRAINASLLLAKNLVLGYSNALAVSDNTYMSSII